MYATGAICPNCRHSDNPEAAAGQTQRQEEILTEYQRRHSAHMRNYTAFMILMFGTGILGIISAVLWFRFIFRGDVLAAILLIPTNIFLLILGYMLKISKRLLPVELNCPGCDVRIDELGLNSGHCPSCHVRLRP
jgi:hypothetical protein